METQGLVALLKLMVASWVYYVLCSLVAEIGWMATFEYRRYDGLWGRNWEHDDSSWPVKMMLLMVLVFCYLLVCLKVWPGFFNGGDVWDIAAEGACVVAMVFIPVVAVMSKEARGYHWSD